MKSKLFLFFILLATVSFCQNDLQAEIYNLESEISNLSSEINKLETKKTLELSAQQLLIDEKQKEEDQQQEIVDQINDELEDLITQLSNYEVNQNQISAYKELSDKEIFEQPMLEKTTLTNKKLIKFNELLKESHDIIYKDYLIVYTPSLIYIINNKGKSRFQKIELNKKEQKKLNNLLDKEILLPLGTSKASFLKMKIGLDQQYFDLLKQKKIQNAILFNEKTKILQIEEEKDKLINRRKEIDSKWDDKINPISSLITRKYDILDELNDEMKQIQKLEEIKKISDALESNTCKIGNQIWMSKNLCTNHFLNGDKIKEAKSVEEFDNLTARKIPCFLDPMKIGESGEKNEKNFWNKNYKTHDEHKDIGYIYNHYSIYDSRGLAPVGWRIPDVEDCWDLLKFCARNKLSHLDFTNEQDYDPTYQSVYCNNCKSWNSEYRSKKACNSCRDTRVIGEKRLYRTNKTKFSHLRSQYTGDYFLLATDENYEFKTLSIMFIGQYWGGVSSYASRRDIKIGNNFTLKKKGFIRLIKN